MAYPIFATSQVLEVGPTNNYYVAGIKDANGHLAAATTQYDLLPSGLLLPRQVDQNGIPLTASRVTTQITDAPLAASAPYEQAWQDSEALAVTFVGGSVYADQAGTLYIDFSNDDTNTAGTSATSLAFTPASAGTPDSNMLPYPVEIPTRYFRFRYVNGSTAQSVFQLYQTPMAQWSPRTVGLSGSLVPQLGWNKYIGTYSVTFAASAAAATVETVAVPIPADVQKDALYLVSVNNPTALATSVTVTFNNGVKFGGSTTDYSEVTSVDVASGAVKSYLVQGWLLGDAAAQISVSNDAAASSTGGSVQFEVTMV